MKIAKITQVFKGGGSADLNSTLSNYLAVEIESTYFG